MSTDASKDEGQIIRLTRWNTSLSVGGRGEPKKSERSTVYGIDEDGNERVYAEFESDEDFEDWKATDPLWREAKNALVDRLLQDPRTGDTVIKINMKVAFDEGDLETTSQRAQGLSPKALREIIGTDTV